MVGKMRHTLVGIALLLSSLLAGSAQAAEGRWTEGFGQGNLEYFIDLQGVRLYIGCLTPDGTPDTPSTVSLMKVSNSQEFAKFTIKAGGLEFDGPFAADSRAGSSSFMALLEALRKTDAVVKVGGKSLTFPKSNAAKVLPVYGTKKFQCNML
jgi:hypothetical protein